MVPGRGQRWLTFDLFGTLVDWESGIADHVGHRWPGQPVREIAREVLVLEAIFSRVEMTTHRHALTRSLRAAARIRDFPLSDESSGSLADSVGEWPPFPAAPPTLHRLRSEGWQLAIIANTDDEMLDAAIGSLDVAMDVLITRSAVDPFGVVFGRWAEFERVTSARRDEYVHVSSRVDEDLVACAELGVRCVWVNAGREASDAPRIAEIDEVGQLPGALRDLGVTTPALAGRPDDALSPGVSAVRARPGRRPTSG